MWSTGEGNGKPLQYSCLENPMNNIKRQNDRILKEKLPRSVGARYATMLLSNNKEPRVKKFGGKVGSSYIYKAGKPGTKNYYKAMDIFTCTISP